MVYQEWMLHWAQSQKRVTNPMIRERFNVDEAEADEIYQYFKKKGVVGTMGHVNKDIDVHKAFNENSNFNFPPIYKRWR